MRSKGEGDVAKVREPACDAEENAGLERLAPPGIKVAAAPQVDPGRRCACPGLWLLRPFRPPDAESSFEEQGEAEDVDDNVDGTDSIDMMDGMDSDVEADSSRSGRMAGASVGNAGNGEILRRGSCGRWGARGRWLKKSIKLPRVLAGTGGPGFVAARGWVVACRK